MKPKPISHITRLNAFEKVNNAITDILPANSFIKGNIVSIRIQQCLGIFPLRLKEDGNADPSWNNMVSIYSAMVTIVILPTLLFFIIEKFQHINQRDLSIDYVYTMSVSVIFSGFGGINACILFDRAKISTYIDRWYKFEMDFNKISSKKLTINLKLFQIVQAVLTVLTAISSCIFNEGIVLKLAQKNNLTLNTYTTHAFSVYCIILCNYTWFNWIYVMQSVNIAGEHFIESLRVCDRSSSAIKKHRLLWVQLQSLATETGSTWTATMTYFYNFVVTISMLMWYIALVVDTGTTGVNFFTAISATLFTASVSEASHRVVETVGPCVLRELNEFLLGDCSGQKEEEIEKFRNMIAMHSTRIVLGGFLTLNRSFTISMYSSIYSTLIVLLQFKTGSGYLKNVSSLPANLTL